jgi:drug/metabolite transporter (DMT)-like permease
MALLGFVGLFVSIVAQFAGTKLSTAANGALITSAVPAFMLVFAWPILGERPTARRVAGLILATLGVLVATVSNPSPGRDTTGNVSSSVSLGNALLVVAAVTWALYSVLGRVANRRYPVVVTTGYATAFGALFTSLLVPAELVANPIGPLPPLVWPGVLYLGVISTAVAFYLWNKSITLLGATLPSILFFAQPIVGGVLGALLLGERLGAAFFLGSTLVALAVLVTARE